jgi:hypothetical protein
MHFRRWAGALEVRLGVVDPVTVLDFFGKRSEAALANVQRRSAKVAVLGRPRRCCASETRRLEQGGGGH